MTRNTADRARRFHAAIKEALIREWDPIGVGHIAEAQDEYDSYVATIYRLLVTGRPRNELFEYLWWVETQHMGLTGDRQATEAFTERLMRIPDEVGRYLN